MSDEPNKDDRTDDVTKALQRALNKNGFGFQYAVIKRIGELWERNEARWAFEASEFPVGTRGNETHIDFVLRRALTPWGDRLFEGSVRSYILAECKRVDPAVGRWCFARASYVSKLKRAERFVVEYAWGRKGSSHFDSRGVLLDPSDDRLAKPYQIPMELRTDGKGDGTGKTMDAAFTQSMRGLNGFVEQLSAIFSAEQPADGCRAAIFPVVFTTAELYATDAVLSDADLATGNIDLSAHPPRRCNWVTVQYNQSRSLRHGYQGDRVWSELSDILAYEFARTIIVVSPDGIADFFHTFRPDLDSIRNV